MLKLAKHNVLNTIILIHHMANGELPSAIVDVRSTDPIPEIPDSVVDNFEEALYEDKGNTLSNYYGGDLSQATRQQTTVFEGSYALEFAASGDSYSISRTDVSVGGTDTITDYVYMSSTNVSDSGPFVCTQQADATPAGYWLTINPSRGIALFRQDTSGNYTIVAGRTGNSLPTGEWLQTEISGFDTGDLVYTIYDSGGTQLQQVSGTDSTYQSGGIGFRATTDTVFYDLVDAQ